MHTLELTGATIAMFAGLYFGLRYILSLIYPDGTEQRLDW